MESFRDNYNGEHFGILKERESFSAIVGMMYTGLWIALFIVWLGSIHILMFPLGLSFTSMFDNQSVGCVTGLVVPLSQSLDNSSLTLSSLDTGMQRLGAWTGVTLVSISRYRGSPRGFPRPGSKIFA